MMAKNDQLVKIIRKKMRHDRNESTLHQGPNDIEDNNCRLQYANDTTFNNEQNPYRIVSYKRHRKKNIKRKN